MIFFISIFLLSLFVKMVSFAPLLILVYLYLSAKKSVVLWGLILGLLWDLFLVFPLGFFASLFLFFLLILELYSKKYSINNPVFIFTALSIFSIYLHRLVGGQLSFVFVLFFLICSLVLIWKLWRLSEHKKSRV